MGYFYSKEFGLNWMNIIFTIIYIIILSFIFFSY
jgi:hypothetical protein